ncbi:adenine deaminase [Bacillus massiliglaciei]|uniref:adenine deaminase n=1 Tax=Bacillus massiliglaciei TaxID=1816693 RepID=UPI000AB3CE90|nr:adenine deaminase [Bacillus massiliglaciei]
MDQQLLKNRIDSAAGRIPADCVIKNGKVVDVFNGEIFEADIAIHEGYFVGIGSYEGKEIIDAEGKYISPSFIDGHVHIESSMVLPHEYAKILLQHGVTCAIADPHEIANVTGTAGIEFMFKQSENLPFDFYFMLPSSVPATRFESSGAEIDSVDLLPLYKNPRVLGLAEVMNSHSVLHAEEDMVQKLLHAQKQQKKIDGHGAGLDATGINVYRAAGISTDHECTAEAEARERLRKGMYLMIREGTVAKDLRNLISVVTERNSRRCLFVTDDRHLDDIISQGSIDHNVRLAISCGISPVTAIQMASLNVAECFGLGERGAISPGYKADFLILDHLEDIKIHSVYKDGKLVNAVNEASDSFRTPTVPEALTNTVHYPDIEHTDFQIKMKSHTANIIEIIPNSLITKHAVEEIDVNANGEFTVSIVKDQLKLAVINRHHRHKQIGLGIIKGLQMTDGAIATTVAHDSHNLIIAGTNDDDMILASKEIKKMQGGLAVVCGGRVLSSLPLPIAGLMCSLSYQETETALHQLNQALKSLQSSSHFNAFLTLSFLSLPVIPEIKLTDQGLFLVSAFQHIPIDASFPAEQAELVL